MSQPNDTSRRRTGPKPSIDHLRERTVIGADCWLIQQGLDRDGYARLWIGGKPFRAHRLAWWLATGHWPAPDENVCHTCDVRNCWRNDGDGVYVLEGIEYERHGHLWLGTNASNGLDCKIKGRTTRGRAVVPPESRPRGDNHPSRLYPERRPRGDQHWTRLSPDRVLRGENATKALLTEETARAILIDYSNGMTVAELIRKYEATPNSVQKLVNGRTWKHLHNL